MTRARGDGGLSWDEKRQRWIASTTIGYDGRGKRLVRRASGRSKTEARNKLRDLLRDRDDGLLIANDGYTVGEAVQDWLEFGLTNRDPATREKNRILCAKHVVPLLGARKLRDLKATEVERWLIKLSGTLSTRTLQAVRACLNRAVNRAMARDRVKRNVVELTEVPRGVVGRPSKALTAQQADAVLIKTAADRFHHYIVVSLLTSARTEELRALRWEHVHLDGYPNSVPPVPPFMEVWRSVREGGETKTRKSRRTLALPARCVEALKKQRGATDRRSAGGGGALAGVRSGVHDQARDRDGCGQRVARLPPCSRPGRQRGSDGLDAARAAALVRLALSDAGVPLEEISRLVGHSGTSVTELVYRHQIRPVIQTGATVMDALFADKGRTGRGA